MQTQGLTAKESKPKKSRPKEITPTNSKFFTLPRFDEAVKFNYQKKKKKYWKKKQDQKNFFLATRECYWR